MKNEEDYKIHAWAKRHGLKWHELNAGAHNFAHLVEPSEKEPARRMAINMDEGDIFDHPRAFVKRMPRAGYAPKLWAIITNPYSNTLRRHHGSDDVQDAAIHEVAGELGLRVRIGDPTDATYWGRLPTTPILWWNPRRFDPSGR